MARPSPALSYHPGHASNQVPASASVTQLVAELNTHFPDRVRAQFCQPGTEGRYADFPGELCPALRSTLAARGIERLYTHQRNAWDCTVRDEKHCVVVTPTASGKSLCFQLPALHAVSSKDTPGKSLYLFPTKALAQDQLYELLALSAEADLGIRAHTFDGDTPSGIRRTVREGADIVITNPDMLHKAILPHHTKWAQLIQSLRYVVIDELHIYRGVFGSHVANVLRRLERICAFYGVSPTYILCSATIANPAELASKLIGRHVVHIADNGAPRGDRHIVLWKPPVVNDALGLSAPARRETTSIATSAIASGLKSIVFGRTRTTVEVLTKYLKDRFDRDPRVPSRIRGYRGGYLPNQRRDVERALRDDELDCVVSTSALELGVDIGGLDVAILNGYPGTIAGTWQRLGRAGRRLRPSLGVLVATSAPLDQFLIRHPELLQNASPEHARIDPNQLLILLDHIRASAFELPFHSGEKFGNQPVDEFLDYLQEQGVLHQEAGRWHWVDESYPANTISLRSVSEGNFLVIDVSGGLERIVGEVDYSAAALTLHEGAIYLMQAMPWQVDRLDWEGRKAFVTPTQTDYYTDAVDYTRLKILEQFDSRPNVEGAVGHGEVHLVRRVPGYKKIRYYTHENVGYGEVRLPDHEMHTSAVWWRVNPDLLDTLFSSRWRAVEALLGAAHALHHVAALFSMCELADIGRSVGDAEGMWSAREMIPEMGAEPRSFQRLNNSERLFEPTVFLYDNYPGGIGLSAPLFDGDRLIVTGALNLVDECPCDLGCPSCIGPVLSIDPEGLTPKQGALDVLTRMRQSTHEC